MGEFGANRPVCLGRKRRSSENASPKKRINRFSPTVGLVPEKPQEHSDRRPDRPRGVPITPTQGGGGGAVPRKRERAHGRAPASAERHPTQPKAGIKFRCGRPPDVKQQHATRREECYPSAGNGSCEKPSLWLAKLRWPYERTRFNHASGVKSGECKSLRIRGPQGILPKIRPATNSSMFKNGVAARPKRRPTILSNDPTRLATSTESGANIHEMHGAAQAASPSALRAGRHGGGRARRCCPARRSAAEAEKGRQSAMSTPTCAKPAPQIQTWRGMGSCPTPRRGPEARNRTRWKALEDEREKVFWGGGGGREPCMSQRLRRHACLLRHAAWRGEGPCPRHDVQHRHGVKNEHMMEPTKAWRCEPGAESRSSAMVQERLRAILRHDVHGRTRDAPVCPYLPPIHCGSSCEERGGIAQPHARSVVWPVQQ